MSDEFTPPSAGTDACVYVHMMERIVARSQRLVDGQLGLLDKVESLNLQDFDKLQPVLREARAHLQTYQRLVELDRDTLVRVKAIATASFPAGPSAAFEGVRRRLLHQLVKQARDRGARPAA